MKRLLLSLLFLSAISQAQIVDIPDANFKNYLITANCVDTDNNGTFDADADSNNDGEIDINESASAVSLKVTGSVITNVEGIENFSNLHNLTIQETGITSLVLNEFEQIVYFCITNNEGLVSAFLSGFDSMASSEIRFVGNSAIQEITLQNCGQSAFVTTGNPSLQSININACHNMQYVWLQGNNLTDLNISETENITTLDIDFNHLESLDLSGFEHLNTLAASNCPLLKIINLKNGHDDGTSVDWAITAFSMPSLMYICTDDSETEFLQAHIDDILEDPSTFNTTPVLNTYCSFTLPGNHNTITGNILFDDDNNGCNSSDPTQPYITLNVSNGNEDYYVFTASDGGFNYDGFEGNFNVTVAMENASLFTITPPLATILFGNNNNNITTQDFCITANGIQNDLETIIVPLQPARPGFDATYKVIYKNKGNQVLSGNVDFNYQENELDFVNASIVPDVQGPGLLSWNFNNLYPFESRSIEVRLNVNSPMETPAVNIGDQLSFSAQVNPLAGDITPDDNYFSFKQTVIGSYDPNDITCLEGEHVNPSEIGKYLHYNINFENTGTATAENIVVKDMIDLAKYDITSLQLLNASHPVTTRITNDKVEFIFGGINLGASEHGNVTFKIRTKNTLVTGNSVSNKADIYFDYNFPVETNVAMTTFDTLGTNEITDNDISIYPNPTNGIVNIKAHSEIKSIALFDVQGRQLLVKNNVETMDISKYNSGVYFIRINSDKGFKTQKLIKQ